jgi:sarcosine oxidase
MTTHLDALILGLGAMGSATLWTLAKRGLKVAGVERFASPHPHGSTHGESRIIRMAYAEGEFYVPLLRRAYERWAELERDTQESLLLQTGGVFFGPPDSSTVRGSAASAAHHGLPHERLSHAQLKARAPWLRLDDDPSFEGLYEPVAGVLPPERGVAAMLREAQRLGAHLYPHTQALSWEADARGVTLHTSAGPLRASRLILTPGAWLPSLLHGLTLPLEVHRLTMFWFDPPGGVEPFSPDRFPIYIGKTHEGATFYGFPAVNGPEGGVKVAFHNPTLRVHPDAVDREVQPHEVEAMRAALRRYLPSLDGPLRKTATCLYTSTPDERFIMDVHPASPRVVVGSCCSGHGFKFTPAVGEVLACLALGEEPPVPIAPFRLAAHACAGHSSPA